MLLEQFDYCEQLHVLTISYIYVWAHIFQTQAYFQFKIRHLARDVNLHE